MDAGHGPVPEEPAHHRGLLQYYALLGGQAVDAGLQHAGQRRRHADLGQAFGLQAPALLAGEDDAVLDQHADQLADGGDLAILAWRNLGLAHWLKRQNASEALEILIFGLDLKRGDEVLVTNQNYPRMITSWQQRERRDGIVLKQVAFKVPPFAGCRNIWMDICYVDEVVCLGADMEKDLYEFLDCCPIEQLNEEVSNLVTHWRATDPAMGNIPGWLNRILPDDQFIPGTGAQPLPSGYPEAIQFEYCSIPDLDVVTEDDTDPAFTFKRETPTCSRPRSVRALSPTRTTTPQPSRASGAGSQVPSPFAQATVRPSLRPKPPVAVMRNRRQCSVAVDSSTAVSVASLPPNSSTCLSPRRSRPCHQSPRR